MLKIIINGIPYSLLSLFAILFIAVGMPLIHPALHRHPHHEQVNAGHCNEHFPAIPDDNEDHECPICDFQATIQLFVDGLIPTITANEHFSLIRPKIHHLLSIVRLIMTEPRAPPCIYQ